MRSLRAACHSRGDASVYRDVEVNAAAAVRVIGSAEIEGPAASPVRLLSAFALSSLAAPMRKPARIRLSANPEKSYHPLPARFEGLSRIP